MKEWKKRYKAIRVATDIAVPKFIVKGFVVERKVCANGNSGAIYVPKKYIGKKFKIVLIPVEEDDEIKI